jgi:hypothetical protein
VVRRRWLEITLGAFWLLDGLLQCQPFMFTREFLDGISGMARMGPPGVATADHVLAHMLVAHPAVWNAMFAGLQVLIGLGLLFRRTARVALATWWPWAPPARSSALESCGPGRVALR